MSARSRLKKETRTGLGRTVTLFCAAAACLLFIIFGLMQTRFRIYVIGATAQVTATLLPLVGMEAEVTGPVVSTRGYIGTIILECTAVFPASIYIAAVLAFPAPWRRKITGLAAGLAAIFLINQVRLISLFLLAVRYPDMMDFAHLVVWQGLMILVTAALWLRWAMKQPGPTHAE